MQGLQDLTPYKIWVGVPCRNRKHRLKAGPVASLNEEGGEVVEIWLPHTRYLLKSRYH